MTTPKPALILDFDGVIGDSIHECLMNALNTYVEMKPNHAFPLSKGLLNREQLFAFEENNPDLFRHFREIMALGNRAEDYAVMMAILDKWDVQAMSDQERFNAFKASMDAHFLETYHQRFYEKRHAAQAGTPQEWVALVPPFDGLADALARIRAHWRLGVATAKDMPSVMLMLRHYGLLPLFESQAILDKSFAKSKFFHLKELAHRFQLPHQHMVFIDDKVTHHDAVSPLGVNCVLAAWGFNGEREKAQARQRGYRVLELVDLPHLAPRDVGLVNP